MSLQSIATAANDLADLLEANAPKGLKHPRHSRHVRPARATIKAVMVKFFARQRRAVLAAVKPKIERELMLWPNTNVNEREYRVTQPGGRIDVIRTTGLYMHESQMGKAFARTLIPSSLQPLTFAATAGEISEYDDAITELISAAAKSLGATVGANAAGEYLRSNSLSKLTGGLNSTSLERLQDALANAWDKGGSYDQMVSAITDTFDDFSTKRADLIAQTESADAYNAGRRETALSLDFDEHAWETESGDPCPICEANEAQGWIDIGDDFDSGDDAPTAHPNCLCVVNFRKSSGGDDEE